MKDLIVLGAGGFGKETVRLVEQINEASPEPQWHIKGFLDDFVKEGTMVYHGVKVIGKISSWHVADNEWYAMGISNPQTKQKTYESIKSRNGNFATLINPAVSYPEETQIGEGTIIGLGWIGCNVKIGKCVHISGSMLGDAEIGDFSTTTGFANIAAGILGKRVFVGSHAVVLNGRRIGDDAFICAGSIVFNHVKAGRKVIGNPARKADF